MCSTLTIYYGGKFIEQRCRIASPPRIEIMGDEDIRASIYIPKYFIAGAKIVGLRHQWQSH